MSATKVTLRKRELPSGKITLYLDFYPPVRNPRTGELSRREYLGIYLFKKPKDATERRSNNEKLQIAEAIRSEREIAILKEQFGFADHTRGKVDFIQYFQDIANEPGNYAGGVFKHFFRYTGGKCTIADVTLELCQEFREYLLSGEASLDDKRFVSHNGASHLWMYFKMVIRRAQKDKLITDDIVSQLESISVTPVHKEYLTIDEVRRLAETPCEDEQVKRASLLACLCGLRISDIESLTWDNVVVAPDQGYALKVITQKTGAYAIIPINEEASSSTSSTAAPSTAALPVGSRLPASTSTSPSTISATPTPPSWPATAPPSTPSPNCSRIPTSLPPRSTPISWTKTSARPQNPSR